ncbi:hypothetical protein ACH4FA_34610 [Streptomyces sp. NPDC017966]
MLDFISLLTGSIGERMWRILDGGTEIQNTLVFLGQCDSERLGE